MHPARADAALSCRRGGSAKIRSVVLRRSAVSVRASAAPARRGSNVVGACEENVQLAVAAFKAGKACAVPTDTLYGFAACASNPTAVASLYTIKGRNENVPLAVCVADAAGLRDVCLEEKLPQGLAGKLLPGAVTLVLERRPGTLCPELNPGTSRIGVRVPDSEFIRRVVAAYGRPLALTSANRSGEPSTLAPDEFAPLWDKCAWVFDGGRIPSSSRAGSTVVDLSEAGTFLILRDGIVLDRTVRMLEEHGLRRRTPPPAAAAAPGEGQAKP